LAGPDAASDGLGRIYRKRGQARIFYLLNNVMARGPEDIYDFDRRILVLYR
jgi:hypothetical protein